MVIRNKTEPIEGRDYQEARVLCRIRRERQSQFDVTAVDQGKNDKKEVQGQVDFGSNYQILTWTNGPSFLSIVDQTNVCFVPSHRWFPQASGSRPQ